MKKQFFRVKQLADQTFSRGGKTDVLSDDLQEADRKVEYIKNSCQNVGKKLLGCLLLGQLQGESGTKEKLMKKSPNYQLGMSMLESGGTCDDESLMKTVLNKCGNAEKTLSEESMEHDHRVEQHVILPLQNVLEAEIPNIIKHKRNVTKVCLDLDSVKTRYQQAQKHSGNNIAGTAKIESIKEELKDCEQKVEQNRDILASEMFHLAARESELCYTILQYYKFQKHYHEYALGILDKLIPELENEICSSKVKPVYGVDLEEHLQVTGRKIAFPIELCVCALLELGMDEEGLFRLAGGASKLKRMKLSFDAGCMTLSTALAYRDPHVIAGALKSYLRELPEPLLTHSLYDEWLNAAKAQTHPDNKLQALWTVVHKLPKANFDNLSYLIKFFHILSKNHEVNRMSPHNIAIVIAPSLIWTKEENSGTGFGLNVNVSLYPSIIDLLVTYADWFFDKEMDFYVTLEPIVNGDLEEKLAEKGIDNKGFDLKVVDKMHRSIVEKVSGQNHPGGDTEASDSDIKRSQSTNSLAEETHTYDSPRPIMRRKNKSVAPGPPGLRDDRKKNEKTSKISPFITKGKESQTISEKPDKPPRPITTSTATLPRSSKIWEGKSMETCEGDVKGHVNDDLVLFKKLQNDINEKSGLTIKDSKDQVFSSEEKTASKITQESSDKMNTEGDTKPIEYSKVNLISVKKEWLLGKESVENENATLRKPAVPERPSLLKSQNFKINRSSIATNLRNNYENISLTSTEASSSVITDDRTLQKTQFYSIDKQKVSIIDVENDKKKSFKITTGTSSDGGEFEKNKSRVVLAEEKTQEPHFDHDEDNSNSDDVHDHDEGDDDKDVKDVIVFAEEEKTASSNVSRLPTTAGLEKPERPPKPDYKISQSSSSHTRTFSDGQIIEKKPSDKSTINNINNINISNNGNNGCSQLTKNVFNNNGSETVGGTVIQQQQQSSPSSPHAPLPFVSVIKHPQTSPPPPPVPAKPRANSQSESTDF